MSLTEQTIEANMTGRPLYKAKVPPEIREMRKLLFLGFAPAAVAKQTHQPIDTVREELNVLAASGVGPDSAGPYFPGQLGIVFGLTPQRIRDLADSRSIGTKVGAKAIRMLSREEAIRLLAAERHVGRRGQIEARKPLPTLEEALRPRKKAKQVKQASCKTASKNTTASNEPT